MTDDAKDGTLLNLGFLFDWGQGVQRNHPLTNKKGRTKYGAPTNIFFEYKKSYIESRLRESPEHAIPLEMKMGIAFTISI